MIKTVKLNLQSFLSPHPSMTMEIDSRTLDDLEKIFDVNQRLLKAMQNTISTQPNSESGRLCREVLGDTLDEFGRLCVNLAARIKRGTVYVGRVKREDSSTSS